MSLVLRAGRPDDAAVCGRICFEAFTAISQQHNFPPDWPSVEVARTVMTSLLAREDVDSVVAELDGQVVGSNFMANTGLVGGIGPITVAPSVQNGAIGRRMMEYMLEVARRTPLAAVRLVQAGFHCRSMALYATLGFNVREPLACMQGPPIKLAVPGIMVRAAEANDLYECCRLCVRVHGHERRLELREAIAQRTATVAERDGRITAYATLIGFWGHAVAATNDDMQALIGAAPELLGAGFLLPTRNGELFRWCLEHGLRMTQPLTLMALGLYNEPAGPFLPSVLY